MYHLKTSAEEVCDDFVVRHCPDRTGYAQQLVELAESNLLAPEMAQLEVASLRMFSRKKMLGNRVGRILDTTRKLTTSVSAPAVATIATLTLSAAMLSGLIGNGSQNDKQIDSVAVDEPRAEIDDNAVKISGRVVGIDGKPVAGAKLTVMPAVNHNFANREQNSPYANAVSKRDGTYELSLDDGAFVESGHAMVQKAENFVILASKSGHGLGWTEGKKLKAADLSDGQIEYRNADIELVSSETPLRLKIVDTEGNPVSKATVKVKQISTYKDNDFSPILENAKKKLHFREAVVGHMDDVLLFPGLPDYETDNQGNVTITGLGDQRTIAIEVIGDSICSTISQHMTMDHPVITFNYGGMTNLPIKYYGANATITCEPTQPIVGKVVDRKTQQPLADVDIFSELFAGEKMSGIHRVKTKSKADGTFKLLGMPKGPGNEIVIIPNDDQPYFMTTQTVPAGPGLTPVEMKIELDKGIWIRGKAIDKNTEEPIVGARLFFLPFLSNKIAAALPSADGHNFGTASIQDRYTTAPDGSFQLVGLPGKSVVGLLEASGLYPSGAGFETIDAEEIDQKRGHAKTLSNPIRPSKKWPSIMQQVDVAADANELNLNFELDSGLSFPLKIMDDAGNPLTGVTISRLRSNMDYFYESTDSNVVAGGFQPGEQRTLKFVHEDKQLALIVQMDAAKEDSRQPRTIQLEPYATIKGRLVNEDGDPVAGGKVGFGVGGAQDFGMRLSERTTNDNGEFVHEEICVGSSYSVAVELPNDIQLVAKKLDVFQSEEIALGTVNIYDVENSPKPQRKPQTAEDQESEDSTASRQSKDSSDNPDADGPMVKFSGTVVNSKGQPVPEAQVRVGLKFKTTSGGDGTFELEVPKKVANLQPDYGPTFLIKKNGYGETLFTAKGKQNGLRLELRDSASIRGKLIDTEGNPVSGATIEVVRVIEFGQEKLERLVASAASSSKPVSLSGNLILMPKIAPAVSAMDGTFTLEGLGAGRVAHLKVVGDNVAIQNAVAVTSIEAVDNIINHFGSLSSDAVKVTGNRPTYICEPSQPIEGIVIDRNTKKPLPNIEVSSYFFASVDPRSKLVGQRILKTTTDANGRFRLTGMPKTIGNEIMAVARIHESEQPYLARVFEVPAGRGTEPVEMELGLDKGVWVSGKVIDQDSKQPMADVRIAYYPTFDNKAALKTQLGQSGLMTDIDPRTDKDGNFKLMGLTGEGVVTALQHRTTDYPHAQGWFELDETLKKKVRVNPNQLTGIKAVKTGGDAKVDFELTRGKTIRVKTVDQSDNPVHGVNVSYLPDYLRRTIKSTQSEFNLSGFLPGRYRTVLVESIDKRMGTLVKIDSDSDSLVKIVLKPNGKLKAKVLDKNGNPIKGLRFNVTLLNDDQQVWRLSSANQSSESGGYEQTLVPGVYLVYFTSPTTGEFSGHKKIAIQSNGIVDLGEVNVDENFAVHTISDPSNPNAYIKDLPVIESKMQKAPNDEGAGASQTKDQPGKAIGQQELTGTVVDLAGKPVANARVRFQTWKTYPTLGHQVAEETKTGAEGEFKLSVSQALIDSLIFAPEGNDQAAIVFTADGYGSRALHWTDKKYQAAFTNSKPLAVSLEPEHVVTGRIVNLEGRPVAGAEIEITSTKSLGSELADKWLADLGETNSYSKSSHLVWNTGSARLYWTYGAHKHLLETNQNGDFTTEGLPADAIVHFQVRHPEVTTQMFEVLNRSMEANKSDSDYIVHGDRPVIVTQPSRPIIGKVVDSQTGDPIPGVKVYCKRMGIANTVYGSSVAPRTHTDKDGNFELLGMPKSNRSRLMIYPPKELPYLIQEVSSIPDTVGMAPAKITVKLEQGVWISGQVTDLETGQGVKAQINYWPLADNPHFLASTGFQKGTRQDHYGFFDHYRTDADGVFKIVGLPGKSVLGATVNGQTYRSGAGYSRLLEEFGQPYSEARIKAAKKVGRDLSQKKFLNIRTSYSLKNVSGSSYIPVNVPTDGLQLEDSIKMDPGFDLTLHVVDPNGDPVNRFFCHNFGGFHEQKDFENGKVTLNRLGRGESRGLWLSSKDGSLALVTTIKGKMSSGKEQTITLQPRAKVRGRLVDSAGKPLSNYRLKITSFDEAKATSDRDSYFEFDRLVVGSPEFDITILRPKLGPDEERPMELGVFTEVNVKKRLVAGGLLNVGDIAVDPTDYWMITSGIMD